LTFSSPSAKIDQREYFKEPQLLFTTSQLCEMTGVPLGTLRRLSAEGSVLAAKPGTRGRGHADLWAAEQVLALAVARGLRSGGVVPADAEQVLKYLWGLTAAALKKNFRAGRTCLMLVLTPNGTRCLPRLVSRNDILDNDAIHQQAATALAAGVSPSALDVEAIWRFILKQAHADGTAEKTGRRATHKAKV
jgi:hypothetical protein